MTDKPVSPNESADKMNGGEQISPVPGTGGMVVRVPPAVGEALLADRVDELINGLELAFRPVPPKPGREREPVIDALVEVARFARSVGCSENVERGLTNFAYALQDLDGGRVAPVLERTKPKGNPPDSSLIWRRRVRVLAAQFVLHQSGMSMEAAAKDIAARHPDLKSLMRRGEDLASSIMHWRRELDETKRGEYLARFSDELIDLEGTIKQLGSELQLQGPDWRQRADNILASIRP